MPRGIGYLMVRRERADPDEPHDWALFIEGFLRRLLARFAGQPAPPPHDREKSPKD